MGEINPIGVPNHQYNVVNSNKGALGVNVHVGGAAGRHPIETRAENHTNAASHATAAAAIVPALNDLLNATKAAAHRAG